MKLNDFLNSLGDVNDMSLEEAKKANEMLQKFCKNAKVTIGVNDLIDILSENETIVTNLICDLDIDDDTKFIFMGIFKTYCNIVLMQMHDKSETTGIRTSTGRWE